MIALPTVGTFSSWATVQSLLAIVLIGSAALKGWEVVNSEEAMGRLPHAALVILVVLELGWGLWLVCGLYPKWTRWATLLLFTILCEVALYQAVTGERSCRCLGRVEASPWLMALIDLTAMIALSLVVPPSEVANSNLRLSVFGTTFLLLAVPATFSMLNPAPQGVLRSLRSDRRLQERVALDFRNAETATFVEAVRAKTSLPLTVDSRLEATIPDLGRINGSFPSWAVLEVIAQKQAIPARWDKIGDGYHLTIASPFASRLTPWLLSAGVAIILLSVYGISWIRQRQRLGTLPANANLGTMDPRGVQKAHRSAFTLVELLVVLGILAILIAITIPAVLKVRAAAAKTQCANHMKQITLACHNFHDDHNRMPPAFGFFPRTDIFQGGNALGNLFFHLLPYVEQQSLYEDSRHRGDAKTGTGGQSPFSKKHDYYFYTANDVHQRQVPIFNCPADPTLMAGINPITNYAPSSIAANYLVFGNVYPERKTGTGPGNAGGQSPFSNRNAQGKPVLPATFKDGTGNTILFAEKYASAWLAKTGTGPGNAGGQSPFSREGGCHWAYFQATCHNPFFAYYDPIPKGNPITDPAAVGSSGVSGQGSAISFQVQPNPQGGCNPCLPATGHNAMNAAMADGSVRALSPGMDRRVWWALVTPAGRDRAE